VGIQILKTKESEGWYIVSEKNKSLYFSDLRFGLLNDNQRTLNLLLAMNLLQLNLIKSS
jgi:hypothetical protein